MADAAEQPEVAEKVENEDDGGGWTLVARKPKAQKEFLVDFLPKNIYTSSRNKHKRLLAVETAKNYEENPAGAVRALIVGAAHHRPPTEESI